MLRSILSSIGRALRGAFGILCSLLSLPARLLGAAFGTGAPAPTGDGEHVRDLKAMVAHNAELEDGYDLIARFVAQWTMDSIVADEPVPAPQPPHVSRAVADWLPGLTRDECLNLITTEISAISAHISGKKTIPGVRPVQRLEPAVWAAGIEIEQDPVPGELYHQFIADGVR